MRKGKKYEGLDDLIIPHGGKTRKPAVSHVTPHDILAAALYDIYEIPEDSDKTRMFAHVVVSTLSMLATAGQDDSVFGDDMNSFFIVFINAINLCARMKAKLDENGIDFDIIDELGGLDNDN